MHGCSGLLHKMQAMLVIVASLVIAAASAQQCSYSSVCSDHTMCKYSGYGSQCSTTVKFSGVLTDADKQAVVNAHNELRRKVALGQETQGNPGPQPAAANMQKLKWDDELATVAQRWADQCNFGHDSCRNVARFYVGQNVYQTYSMGSAETGDEDWKGAVQSWYNEVKDFSNGNISPFKFTSGTGHYTQVVWAETTLIGCGFVAYKDSSGWYDKYYVCNYGKGGNMIGGTMYQKGTACSKCSGSCENGLCV